MGLQFLILIRIGKGTVFNSLKACLITFLTLIVLETSIFTLLTSIFHVDIFSDSIQIRILTGLPQVFVLFLLAFITHKFSTR
jgi:hypothetical protein